MSRSKPESPWSRAGLAGSDREQEDVPPYTVAPGVKPNSWPSGVIADETDFFGWYFQIPRAESIIGWPVSHRNWMAERLGMNRLALDSAILRTRHRQEQSDDVPFYRLSADSGSD